MNKHRYHTSYDARSVCAVSCGLLPGFAQEPGEAIPLYWWVSQMVRLKGHLLSGGTDCVSSCCRHSGFTPWFQVVRAEPSAAWETGSDVPLLPWGRASITWDWATAHWILQTLCSLFASSSSSHLSLLLPRALHS